MLQSPDTASKVKRTTRSQPGSRRNAPETAPGPDAGSSGWSKALEFEGWAETLSTRNKESDEHTLRVADMTVRLARRMGFSEAEIVHIRRGALLHDVGRMGVPDPVLTKAGQLDDEEWAAMRQHPNYAYDLIYPIEYLRPCLSIPYSHHERWDGSGYPLGLQGDQIPLAARIFAVVDVYDALVTERPYRPALLQEYAIGHICSQAGHHFDPAVVESFMAMMLETDPLS